MNDYNINILCRICLQEGATFPIFEKAPTNGGVYNKLLLCLHCEKIEDAEGFPRHICLSCNTILETIYNFINKYKESSKILEDSIKIIKKETIYPDASINYNEVKEEIEVEPLKENSDEHFDDDFDIEIEKPLITLRNIKNDLIKKESKTKKTQTRPGCRTNKIASSILEGNFLWTGEKWCMKKGQAVIKRKALKPRPQTKVKVPNVNIKSEQKLCDLCGDTFKTQDKLNLHKKKTHYKTPVKCPKCSKVCVSAYYLKKHIKRKHESSKDFICSTCGHGFAFKSEMTSHYKKVHDKHLHPKKIFACKICEKSYKCQKSVLIHERSVHTGQRPAQCSVCGSSFYHDDYLKEHMRLHTGETPFKCPICGRGYAQRGNMKSHLRIHRISELDAATLSKIKPNYLKLLKV